MKTELINEAFYAEDRCVLCSQSGSHITFRELIQLSASCFQKVNRRCLVMLVCDNSAANIILYISCVQNHVPVIMVDAKISQKELFELIVCYQPAYIWLPEGDRVSGKNISSVLPGEAEEQVLAVDKWKHYRLYQNPMENKEQVLSSELAVLLATSEGTGSKKYVMLSYENLFCNADSIAESVAVCQGDRAAVMLPIAFSYGLSIVNSYIRAGGTLLVPESIIVEKEYWDFLEEEGVNALFGVPYTYELFRRINLNDRELTDLKLMTQAGGAMELEDIDYFLRMARQRRFNLAVMYGQTEATARISSFFLNQHPDKIGSVGKVVPGGKITIRDSQYNKKGEIVYQGLNVFMGYARSYEDLCIKDNVKSARESGEDSVLLTGDVGYIDQDGYLYITGRISRLVKICGHRVSLDELQEYLTEMLKSDIVCVGKISGRSESIYIVQEKDNYEWDRMREALEQCRIGLTAFRVYIVGKIPRRSNGNVDYVRVKKLICR